MRLFKLFSWFLGVTLFATGILKFFDPFKFWYSTQITNSGLGEVAYYMGIVGEIGIGLGFLIILILYKKIPLKYSRALIIFFSVIILFVMSVGIHIHLHPNVPAEVLPLKIKLPYIPGIYIIIASGNIFSMIKSIILFDRD